MGFVIAQVAKVFTHYYTERKWDLSRLVGSGGMPSSHTALVRSCPQQTACWGGSYVHSFGAGVLFMRGQHWRSTSCISCEHGVPLPAQARSLCR